MEEMHRARYAGCIVSMPSGGEACHPPSNSVCSPTYKCSTSRDSRLFMEPPLPIPEVSGWGWRFPLSNHSVFLLTELV